MSAAHVVAAREELESWLYDGDRLKDLGTLRCYIRDGRYEPKYLDVIGQQHGCEPTRWPLEQVLSFGRMHSAIIGGDAATAVIGSRSGRLPGPSSDRARAENAAKLANLCGPFTAYVDPDQGNADADGTLSWEEPILLEKSLYIPVLCHCGVKTPVKCSVTIPPGSVPLEIGTTLASRTWTHFQIDRGVARWPYGHDRIELIVNIGPYWENDVMDGVL